MRPFSVAVALFALASTTFAAEPRIDFAPTRALRAGEVVEIRWTGLPHNVEELEFLLERDGGDVVRLTEQLLPSSSAFRWIVPDLPSRRAALVLRAGIERREVTLATSAPFVIEGTEGRARLQFRNGEWWTVEFRRPATHTPQFSFMTEVRAPQPFECSPRPLFLSAHAELGGAQPLERLERTMRAANTRCGAPLTIPQRK